MNKERPILFSTDMVNAILGGHKTQTRRVIKPQPTEHWMKNVYYHQPSGEQYENGEQLFWLSDGEYGEVKCPYGRPGDKLWVRETWAKYCYADEFGVTHYDQDMIFYKADGTPDLTIVDADGFEEQDQNIKWKPSIHMPKDASRIKLLVKNIKVERLQDISKQDAVAEGIEEVPTPVDGLRSWKNYLGPTSYTNPVTSFQSLWDSINGKKETFSWEGNPWVWVVGFENIETN